MATAQDIITDAFTEIGVVTNPGQTPSAEHSAFGLNRLNQLVQEWNTRRAFLYTTDILTFALTVGQNIYTIGPASTTPDFVTPRPVGPQPGSGILMANIILAGNPDVYVPMGIMDDQEWAALRVRDISSTVPLCLYNDGANPKSNIYIYGTPSEARDIELWVKHQTADFASLATTFEVPMGYQKAITQTLAENLAAVPAFARYGASWSQLQAENARKARAAVAALNSGPNNMPNDAAGVVKSKRSTFNYLTGNLQ
jgi:hypothetical protein